MRKVYIAASWKHQHAVEMLTTELRKIGFDVLSFVESNHGEGHSYEKPMGFEEWMLTPAATKSFVYDTFAAMTSDVTIYIGPSGKDAAAEVGMAFASGKYVIGLYAKGEDFGLMRRMFRKWFSNYRDMLEHLTSLVFPEISTSPSHLESIH